MRLIACLIIIFSILSCNTPPKELPIIGFKEELPNGEIKYHKIPPFSFTNQLGNEVTNATFTDKIYVADFFFTSCPSICPKVMKQMIRIHDKYTENDKILLVSHTIDPKRDTEETLKRYAENLDVDQARWHFLTGEKEELLGIADDYYVAAYEDPEAPGGFDHSGKILLIDTDGHIRAFCDGTDPEDVTEFLKDIDVLLASYEG